MHNRAILHLKGGSRKAEELREYQKLMKKGSPILDQYLVAKDFYTEWFDFVQAPPGEQEDGPEIIDNEALLHKLRQRKPLKIYEDYHKVNDELFEFFFGIYGCNVVLR